MTALFESLFLGNVMSAGSHYITDVHLGCVKLQSFLQAMVSGMDPHEPPRIAGAHENLCHLHS